MRRLSYQPDRLVRKATPWENFINSLFGIKKDLYYSSTVDILNLGFLETWVKQLRSPEWPEQYLPAIDRNIAAEGAHLYQQNCASCHQVISREDEGQDYIAHKGLLSELGTDPAMAWNAAKNMARPGILSENPEVEIDAVK